MEVDSDRDWTVVGWCWFGHKTAHPTTSILPHSRARSARRSRRNHAFMSADPKRRGVSVTYDPYSATFLNHFWGKPARLFKTLSV
jgi:hypothetical protein